MLKFLTDDKDLLFAINEVLSELPHSDLLCGEYTLVKIANGLEITKTANGGRIGYADTRSLLRAISILSQNRDKTEFYVKETPDYDILGAMPDASRNAVPKIETLKKFCRVLALEGYNTLMLYMEDVYEIKKYPYFGHLRGRYSKEELQDLDKYAALLGIELVPAIQTLAHLNGMFEWPASYNVNDCDDIMLVGADATYELIEEMIKTCADIFTSRKINIGLDEAKMLGSGVYLDKNGYKYRPEIMAEHMPRVKDICLKYGFAPRMWSDMFFRMINEGVYRVIGTNVPQKIIDSVPPELTLVYWDYSQTDINIYEDMFRQHKAFKNPIAFAGGTESWYGLIPLTVHSKECTMLATQSLHNHGIKEVYVTMWGDDGGACSLFSSILPLFIYGEACWSHFEDREEWAAKRLEVCTGMTETQLLDLERVHDLPGRQFFGKKMTNPSKYMLYANILTGKFDAHTPDGSSEHFAKMADVMREHSAKTDGYSYIFDSVATLCDLLSVKSELGKKLTKAYLANDKDTVKQIADNDIPTAIKKMREFKATLRKQWYTENKNFGFDIVDARIGGALSQLETAIYVVNEWLDNKTEHICELEQPRLEYVGDYHRSYDNGIIELNRWERMVGQNMSNMFGFK